MEIVRAQCRFCMINHDESGREQSVNKSSSLKFVDIVMAKVILSLQFTHIRQRSIDNPAAGNIKNRRDPKHKKYQGCFICLKTIAGRCRHLQCISLF